MRRATLLLLLLLPACVGTGEAPAGRVLRFQAEDGVRLVGEIRGAGPHGVVLAHMFGSDRESWARFAETVAGEGSVVLTFDFRGFGDSGGTSDPRAAPRDLAAAVEAIRGEGATEVVLIGASFAGTAALRVASSHDVDGVATLSAPASFEGLTASREVVEAVDAPKLFIAAQGDAAAADAALGYYDAASGAKRVEIVPGDDHGTALLGGRQGEQVRRLLLAFLARQRA